MEDNQKHEDVDTEQNEPSGRRAAVVTNRTDQLQQIKSIPVTASTYKTKNSPSTNCVEWEVYKNGGFDGSQTDLDPYVEPDEESIDGSTCIDGTVKSWFGGPDSMDGDTIWGDMRAEILYRITRTEEDDPDN